MKTCTAMHDTHPTLLCVLASGHRGWHRDDTYGRWRPIGADKSGDPGVGMPTKTSADRYNEAVAGFYDDLSGCVGILAVVPGVKS